MKKIAVFCSGYGSNFEAIAKAAAQKKLGAEVALMVCDQPGAYVLKRAHRSGTPVVLLPPKAFQSKEDYEKVLVSILKNQRIDAVILAGFMRIFTPYFVKAYRNKILNIHPSYLPHFKGARAIQDAYHSKVSETGVTVHLVTDELDAGPILVQKKVKILKSDSLKNLEEKIHRLEHQIYPLAIRRFLKKRKGKNV